MSDTPKPHNEHTEELLSVVDSQCPGELDSYLENVDAESFRLAVKALRQEYTRASGNERYHQLLDLAISATQSGKSCLPRFVELMLDNATR